MKEIDELFQLTEVEEIKKHLEVVIQKIEEADKIQQELLLKQVVEKAKETEKKLKEKCTIMEGLSFFSENIAPLALLVEEISNDADNGEDMLKVLKFNLNNYFGQFRRVKRNDWHAEIEDFEHIIHVLMTECKYFDVLKKHGFHLSIMMFDNRYRRCSMEMLNYSAVKNKNFAIHSFYCEPFKENTKTVEEIGFEQFGYLLKEILVGISQKAPDGFLELFDSVKDMPEVDDESKELTGLFGNTFAHYIIEKMEIRVAEHFGKDKIEHLESRDEEFVHNMLIYFDKLFDDLLTEAEEWEDNKKCPCGSGKKYKNCCKKRRLKYYKGKDENHYSKAVPMHPELEPILEEEKIRFKQLFGRLPGDLDYVHGGVLLKDFERGYKLLKRNNTIDKAWLYASDKTGYMLTEENQDLIPEREVKEFQRYLYEYKKLMKSKIKGQQWNILQAVEGTSFILEMMMKNELDNMIYVLNLCVNFYSSNSQEGKKFIIHNIKDFLVFCAYKASLQLRVLKELVNGEYYDTAMAEVRIIYEILISMRAYKQNPDIFKEKILSVMGVELGTHRKVDNKSIVEEIETGKRYKYEIQKKQLAEKAGENYKKLYETLYRELSEFIHLDTESAKGIFQDKDLFEEIDECLIAGFLGMVLSLEIIMELIDFDGGDKKMSKDLKYFSNSLLKDFLAILSTIISIEDREVYHLLQKTLEAYKTDYKINYQRNNKCEVC